MSILSKIAGSGITSIVSEVGSIVDSLSTSTEEKMKLKAELETIFNERIEIQSNDESNLRSEISKRWTSDAKSDMNLAKVIRPLTLILWTVILIGIMTTTIFMDMKVQQLETLTIWMPLIQTIVITIYAAYFGGRSLEKIVQTNTDSKMNTSQIDYIKTVDTTKILKDSQLKRQEPEPVHQKREAVIEDDSFRSDMDEFLNN